VDIIDKLRTGRGVDSETGFHAGLRDYTSDQEQEPGQRDKGMDQEMRRQDCIIDYLILSGFCAHKKQASPPATNSR
jgi:hypothetical protein